MTRAAPLRLLSGLVLAVLVCSCATDTAVDPAAAPAASAQGGNPGGPVGGEDTRTDAEANGNPGAPGDVAVFEEAGVPYSVLRADAATKCAGGVCRLLEPVPAAGDPADVGGLDECVIREQSDIHYQPPAEGGFFRTGATVQAHVDCTVEGSGGDGTGTSASDPSASAGLTDEPQD